MNMKSVTNPAPPRGTAQDSSSYVRYSAAWSIARVLEHAARVGDPGRQLVLAAGVGLIIQRLSLVVVDGKQPLHVRRSACQTFWPLARLFQGPANSATSPLSPHFTNILQVGLGLRLGWGRHAQIDTAQTGSCTKQLPARQQHMLPAFQLMKGLAVRMKTSHMPHAVSAPLPWC